MSEKEKKRRDVYRKNREKWIFAQSVIITIISLAVLISAIVSVQLNSKYYVSYTESGSINYNVFLKDNEFFEDEYLGKDQSYVASLIDKIIADFRYEIDMDTDDVNYRYSYTIKSRLEIIDGTSNVAIFNPEYELVNVQSKTQNSSNRLIINETALIKYDEYNDLANNFIDTYGLTSTKSNIVVTLDVDVLSSCDAFAGSTVDTYTSELRIPLTTKTVNIKMTSAVPDDASSMIACVRGAESEVFKTTAIVLGVVDALLIMLLAAFIYLTRTPDVTYAAKVKKIIGQYKSYIQKINNMFETYGYQLIYVDTFDEMLEIRDTIQAPVLMYENEDKTCTKFIIPTDSKLLYIYEIKVEGYTDPVEVRPEPTATTIVKPNITNVVRPVVKVVVTPPAPQPQPEAQIETIIEDAEVEIEAPEDEAPEVIATVEEEFEEIEEILDSIPAADDETVQDNTVDVIDVVWEERSNKAYRYDPDGNEVEEGDIVLVPTKDVHSDKEVVREAEVSRGNYKVDPETLNHPLKKIIGVVRRKAEKVFTAIITPDDEN